MTKLAILYSEYSPTVDALKNHFKDYGIDLFDTLSDELINYSCVIGVNFCQNVQLQNMINIHYSLLPSFKGENPIKQAILAGVKVSGLTIFKTNPFKILAQYPVFLTNDKHFDDIEREMQYLEQTLYPLVIEKVLKGEQFEVRDLLKRNNCGGCGGCKH